MNEKYPRILHSGVTPIGSATSSGVTSGSMFSEWPDPSLCQLLLREPNEHSARGSVVVMPPGTYPLNDLARFVMRGRTIRADHHLLHNAVTLGDTPVPISTRLKILAVEINDLGPAMIGSALSYHLSSFRPQIVHSFLGTIQEMRIALAVSQRYDIPILPHFTDDWPSTIYGDGQLWGKARAVARRLLAQILERSPLLLTIGVDMATEFSKRYSKPTVAIGNSIDASRFVRSSSQDSALVYAGGLHLGRGDQISRVASVIESRASLAGLTIDIYTGTHDQGHAAQLSKMFSCVRAMGSINPEEVVETLARSHAALFIESAEPGILNYTRLSVSTKVPEYLSALSPILAIGPSSQSSVTALRQAPQTIYGGDGRNLELLERALEDLEANSTVHRSRAVFPSWYSSAETSERLKVAVQKSISAWKSERP